MPNEPLQNFRAVEPANYSFGSSATIASQPFVLNHLAVASALGNGTPIINGSVTFSVSANNSTDRFLPWKSRLFVDTEAKGAYYPVAVPNAYDRIYIFPMYMMSTDDTQVLANVTTLGLPSSYNAPWVLPMGLAPQTRGFSTSNKLNPRISRLPGDLISQAYPTHRTSVSYDVRNDGIWNPLPAYSSNFSTSNGLWDVGSGTNPSSYGRATIGTGTAYALPDDYSVSLAASGAVAENNARLATGSATVIGMGHEFQTMGSEEIVCCIGAVPTGVTITHPNSTGKTYVTHLFMMGMFLG